METMGQDVNAEVGRRIRNLRVVHGKSQSALGTVLGLTFQQIQKYERGFNKISVEKLWLIAQYFEVEVSYFFENIDQAAATEPENVFFLDKNVENNRLRLEIGRGLQRLQSPKILRGLLALIRSVVEQAAAKAAE